jgi:D-inositol-3-phosphate glycosyltransferase
LGQNGSGGMNVFLREVSSSLSEYCDVKTDIFTRRQSLSIEKIKEVSSQVRVIHLKGGPERQLDRKNVYDFIPEFSENLKKYLKKQKSQYDIVYSNYWMSGLLGETIKNRFSIPLVHTYHTLAFMKTNGNSHLYSEHTKRIKSEKKLSYASDGIISFSNKEKEFLEREYKISPKKVRLIYPGVNNGLFDYSVSKKILRQIDYRDNEIILLYVGRIDPVKGLAVLIKAINELKDKSKDLYNKLRLIIIGGGKPESDFKTNKEYIRMNSLINEKGLEKKIKFLGSKRNDHLYRYYSVADAVVIPSISESFGLVALEALACGTPVIGSQTGGIVSIIKEGKNGFSFKPNDHISLSWCLEKFCINRSSIWSRDKIRGNVIADFSWKKTAMEMYAFFKEKRAVIIRHRL